jgi:serine protease Do
MQGCPVGGPLEAVLGTGSGPVSGGRARTWTQATAQPRRRARHAVVRAAERVSPRRRLGERDPDAQVRVRDPFDDFFGGFWGFEGLGGSRTESRRVPGLGSGFVIDDGRLILTNDHVVRGAERILVTFPDGRDVEAELVGSDEATDVAVLRAEGWTGSGPCPMGRSDDLRIGEWVIAFGNPFGNLISNPEPTVTVGVVSALGATSSPPEERRLLPRDDPDRRGHQPRELGGPLVNALGEVVGMNASIFSRGGGSEGLGFAIPIERVLRIADDLVAHGTVRRAWIGVEVEAVDADEFGRTRGVRVARVPAESPPRGRAGVSEPATASSGPTTCGSPPRWTSRPSSWTSGPGTRCELEVEGRSATVVASGRGEPGGPGRAGHRSSATSRSRP